MQLTDSSVQSGVSVLFVHVVDSSSGLILEDDAESFDMTWSSFKDFVDWKDLALSAFGFEKSSQMVPEFGFGDDVVSSEQSEGVDFGIGVLFSGEFSSHDKELSDLRLIMSLLSFAMKNQWDLDFL